MTKLKLAMIDASGALPWRALLPVFGSFVISAGAATFDEQRAAVASSIETQPESVILSLLRAGIDESRPTQAAALASEWLRQNLPQDPVFFHHAGRNSELAGDFRGAVALYQQFLEKGDPKSPAAGEAITAVHALLIQELNDPDAAFVFGLNQAGRLAANPRFRQWDRWFLDAAEARDDREAVAGRLLATLQAGVSDDVLVALYERDFRWLEQAIRSTRYDQKENRFSRQFVTTVKELAKALRFDRVRALLLDWAVSVKDYNMARIDGEAPAPPLAEAKALLDSHPQYAEQVQTDWAGGHNGQHYRDDPKKYWPHEIEAKMAPVRAALEKLPPLAQADLLRAWSAGYYAGGPAVFTPLQARAFVLENPSLVNRKSGPILSFEWNKLGFEEAGKLAVNLSQNPSPEASLVFAIRAAGEEKNLDKAIDALLGPEAWRLGPAELGGQYADQLWHWAGRPGDSAKRDQGIARSKELLVKIQQEALKTNTPPDQRLGEFRRLWSDYRSAQPKIPAVVSRLQQVLLVTPEAVPGLLRDDSLEAQLLLRDALAKGFEPPLSGDTGVRGLTPDRYDPVFDRLIARHRRDVAYLKQQNLYRPNPIEPALRNAVAERLRKNRLEPWLALAWLNSQFPEDNAEQVKLAEAIIKSPVWQAMPPEVRFGFRSWFKQKALTPAQFAQVSAINADMLCNGLFELPGKPNAATAGKALQTALEGLMNSPVRIDFTEAALEKVSALTAEEFADPQVFEPVLRAIDQFKTAQVPVQFGNRLIEVISKSRDPMAIHRSARFLWQHVNRHMRSFQQVMALTDSLLEKQPSAASALARAGLDAFARHRGHSYFDRASDIPLLKSIRGRASLQMGLVVIPVPQGHPAYPVYQSQAEWTIGNEDTAWSQLDGSWDAFLPIHREMSVSYLLWVLQQTIYTRAEERQESLVKALLGWTSEAGSPLSPVEKFRIELAYGDIAIQRGQLRQAHEIFARTEKNQDYAGLPIRHQATLRRARAERMAKDFDGALNTLNELALERVPELWSDIRYALAEVHYDMEEFDDAKDAIDAILTHEPNHPDARILLGKIQLKRQKLMEATEVELGSSTTTRLLVPGEKLKVTLNDPTLAVSGAGTEIEVKVWAASGDEERFFLRRFGDQKTKFRGEVSTALGAPVVDDGTLQVIGDDQVFYSYTERFLEKMNLVDDKRGGPIMIASDALLMASARKLLTEAEQRSADMAAVMTELQNKVRTDVAGAARARIAARSLDAGARAATGEITETGFERYLADVAKPGNPIHVRVIDPDRSRTAEIDELSVSVSTSSGDSIARVTLRETGTHSGWFEGSIPTTGAQAMAFAGNSEPGRNPNMVISPKTDYPDWRPTTKSEDVHRFTIDLNDNLPLGEMTITAAEPNARLQQFLVQTAMNQTDWTTVGTYPAGAIAAPDPWKPSVTVVNEERQGSAPRREAQLPDLREHLESGWLSDPEMALAVNVAGPSDVFPAAIAKELEWKRQGRFPNPAVISCFRAWFHENDQVLRHFRLSLGPAPTKNAAGKPKGAKKRGADDPMYLLAIDGRVINDPESDLIEGELTLKPGLHRIEIWSAGWMDKIGFGRSAKLQANIEAPDKLSDCPDSLFDPATFPEGSIDHRNAPASIASAADGASFTVKFAPDSRTRLLRLIIAGHEGPVPALNKIALTRPDGKRVLPVLEDFAELNRNNTLEMLTGDRISVRYVDDRFVTKAKEKIERSLSVSFTDARVEFADMEDRFDTRRNKMMPFYERLIRFNHGEPLALAIHDADMDVSGGPDKVTVKLEAGGKTREFEAVETAESTGVFKLVITPVAGSPAKDGEFQVASGGTITATYLDRENNRPGVPTERAGLIDHATFVEPAFLLNHAEVVPWEPEAGTAGTTALVHGFETLRGNPSGDSTRIREQIRPRWEINRSVLPASSPPDGGFATVHGRRMYLEIAAPQLALRPSSEVVVFAQTGTGRKAANGAAGDGFDTNLPGTIELRASLPKEKADWSRSRGEGIPEIASYQDGALNGFARPDLTDRFVVSVPLVAGVLPSTGVLSEEEREALEEQAKDSISAAEQLEALRGGGLVVQPGDTIHLGFRYTDAAGAQQWLTGSTRVITHPVFDLMSGDFIEPMTSAYVGENLNLRVVDLGADTSDAMDAVNVLVQAKSGAKVPVELRESGPHTGIFRGSYQISYAREGEVLPDDYDARRNGFPVVYGDTVAARYTDGNGVNTETLFATISKGADGTIRPFSKIYGDEEVAMRTQFSLAEAYLETAKRYRGLGEAARAEQDYATAKLLLSKAMDRFTDAETRAHAEYLLGALTMEEALAAADDETRETRFRAALSRFMTVTGSYPDTIHASRAQYRMATVYEALKEPEIAAQEYVKLAYKYPDSEFLATSMARLGSHFLAKATAFEKQAKPLLEKAAEDKDAEFEGKALQKLAEQEYLKTASIFGRLQERFPSHELAGQAGLRAGQAYMRAGKNKEAVDAFQRVMDEDGYDGPSIRAQALYWTGMCWQALRQEMAAYSVFKRLTYDFPESEWAAYARGQLSQERLLNLENKLELERLESGR